MTVAQLIETLQTALPEAEVTIGPLVELVDRIEIVNQPFHPGSAPYVVLLPAPVDG